MNRTSVKIGNTHYRYVEFETFAYVAKFHEYADGSKQCLSFEFGWPLLVQAIHAAQVYERQGHDAFFSADQWLEDMPTEAHRRGYREAERNLNYLVTAERMENYDQVNRWQY